MFAIFSRARACTYVFLIRSLIFVRLTTVASTAHSLPVQKLIDSNKLPHLLFYGPPGTGKTSTILACAKKLYGADFKMMVLEVRACVRACYPCVYHTAAVGGVERTRPSAGIHCSSLF